VGFNFSDEKSCFVGACKYSGGLSEEEAELWARAQEGLRTLQGLISYIEKSGV